MTPRADGEALASATTIAPGTGTERTRQPANERPVPVLDAPRPLDAADIKRALTRVRRLARRDTLRGVQRHTSRWQPQPCQSQFDLFAQLLIEHGLEDPARGVEIPHGMRDSAGNPITPEGLRDAAEKLEYARRYEPNREITGEYPWMRVVLAAPDLVDKEELILWAERAETLAPGKLRRALAEIDADALTVAQPQPSAAPAMPNVPPATVVQSPELVADTPYVSATSVAPDATAGEPDRVPAAEPVEQVGPPCAVPRFGSMNIEQLRETQLARARERADPLLPFSSARAAPAAGNGEAPTAATAPSLATNGYTPPAASMALTTAQNEPHRANKSHAPDVEPPSSAPLPLEQPELANLRESGLPDAAIRELSAYTTRDAALIDRIAGRELSRQPRIDPRDRTRISCDVELVAMVIPCVQPDGVRIERLRLRHPTPEWDREKRQYTRETGTEHYKPAKYISPSGMSPPLSWPRNSLTLSWLRDATVPVYFVEGEKKRALLEWVLCWLGVKAVVIGIPGIDNAHDTKYSEAQEAAGAPPDEWYRLRREITDHCVITGRHIVIVFDRSTKPNPREPHAAQRIANMLYAAGAASVRYCTPRGKPKGIDDLFVWGATWCGDFALSTSRDVAESLEARDVALGAREVQDCIDKATLLHCGGEPPTTSGTSPSTWSAPQALPTLICVPAWDERLLPESLRPWLADVVDRTQCPAEYVAVGAIVSLASVIGRQCAIRPKRQDDWTIVPNLWGAIVGPPSAMKSPALAESMRPLLALAKRAAQDHVDKASMREELDAQVDAAKKLLRRAAAAGEECTELRAKHDALRAEFAAANTERRYVIYDSTTEKLGEILNANRRGVLLFRDELVGWLSSLDRQGRECDRAFFLESWNGTSEFVYDRIGRGTVRIEAACVSVLGGIQPGPLGTYLTEAMSGGVGADGLMQRFQLLVYPDPPRDWRNVDRWPDTDARRQVVELFSRLSNICPEDVGARVDIGGGIPYVRFAADAQEAFDAWLATLMRRARAGEEHEAFVGHLIKYTSLMPSLALVFELGAGGADYVRLQAAELAIHWCTVLEAHARRVYASVTGAELSAARALLARLRRSKLPNSFTARDVYRNQWSGLTDAATVDRALEVLEAYGWVRLSVEKTGGRPRLVAQAHPAARGHDLEHEHRPARENVARPD